MEIRRENGEGEGIREGRRRRKERGRGAEREINPPPLGGFSSSYLLSKKVSDIAVEIYKPLLPLYPSIFPSPRSL
jgi:hypothetical protein